MLIPFINDQVLPISLCKLEQPLVDIGPTPYYYESFTSFCSSASLLLTAVSLTANVLGAEAMTSPLVSPSPTLHNTEEPN